MACLACPSLYRQMMARASAACSFRPSSLLGCGGPESCGRWPGPTSPEPLACSLRQVDCPEVDAQIFEFDRRFEQLEKFTFYDYNDPEDVPDYLHHEFDVRSSDRHSSLELQSAGARRPCTTTGLDAS